MAKTRTRQLPQIGEVTARVAKPTVTISRAPTVFEARLFKLCKLIPAGKVSTYGAMAKVLGSSSRAVGQGMKRNPFAPIVPCHRVIASDLTLGGFSALTVRRLVKRDKTTFLGNKVDILDKFTTEFDEGPSLSEPEAASASQPEAAPTPVKAAVPIPSAPASVNPFANSITTGRPVSADNPFKAGPAPASPFGSAGAAKPFKQSIEPLGLNPDMSPDPIVKEAPFDFLKSITLTQGVIAGSFVFVIALMLVTFNVAVGAGAIRLSGI
ncbi:MAG: hypothetical protein WDW36_009793 [Sanguina aurantia]